MVYSGVISDLAAPRRLLTLHRDTRSATVEEQLATLSQCAGQRSSESRNVITTFKHFQQNVFTGLRPTASCAPTPIFTTGACVVSADTTLVVHISGRLEWPLSLCVWCI